MANSVDPVSAHHCICALRKARKEGSVHQQHASALRREELGLLLRTCQEHFPVFYPFVSLLARTGLRLGEAIGLQWGEIDVQGRFIEVRRTLSDRRVTTPKSGKSRRVDMSQQLTETFRTLLLERKKETLRKG
jgi:integrase